MCIRDSSSRETLRIACTIARPAFSWKKYKRRQLPRMSLLLEQVSDRQSSASPGHCKPLWQVKLLRQTIWNMHRSSCQRLVEKELSQIQGWRKEHGKAKQREDFKHSFKAVMDLQPHYFETVKKAYAVPFVSSDHGYSGLKRRTNYKVT